MTIAEEAQRYLEVVEFFRSQGCEPQWRPEPHLARRRDSTHSAAPLPPPSLRSKRWSR